MDKAFSAKQTETNQTQATPAQQPTNLKQPIQRAADASRLPFYAQAWGNRPPPGLRLSVPEPATHEEEPLQKQAEPLQRKENTTGLPDTLKTGVETLSGMSLDDVQVHYNSAKPAGVQALAYTQGTEIHVGPGQEQHLAHEAWHVVQQKQGRVQPTLQGKGIAINADEVLEREADVMGDKAVQMRSMAVSVPIKGVSLPILTKADKAREVQAQQDRVVPPVWSSIHQAGVEEMSAVVIQRKTTLKIQGQDMISDTDVVESISHKRDSVHSAAAKRAMGLSGWDSVPGGTICNHSISYNRIFKGLEDRLAGNTVQQVARDLHTFYSQLAEAENKDGHLEKVMNDVAEGTSVKRDTLDQSLHYYIYKICDYPGNLFYWPRSTGPEPDIPQDITHIKLNKSWVPSDKSYDKTGQEERDRLEGGSDEIESNIGDV